MDKKTFRNMASETRNRISLQERVEKSDVIFEKILELPCYRLAKHLFLYLSFRSEVDTFHLLHHALNEGKQVYAPITLIEQKELLCCRILDPNSDLVRDRYGILSPRFSEERLLPPEKIDLVIVPGLAFDEQKYRMGYGGGFYDRFIPKLSKQAATLALAFEQQIYPKIPVDAYDSRMDLILTEERLF